MPAFPSAPIAPQEFLESFLPKAFAEVALPDAAAAADLQIGVALSGEGGGEWLLHLADGALAVTSGARDAAALSVCQSIEDWRGALWEGRGGPVGRRAAALFRAPAPGSGDGGMAAAGLGVVDQLAALDGLIQLVVQGGEGGDWSLGIKLGPGALPAEPQASLLVTAADADAMESGELDAMQAFMAGRIQVQGDMTLFLQLQAVLMQAGQGTGFGSGV